MTRDQIDEKRKNHRTQGAPENIRMVPVESSNIKAVGYDGDEEILFVTFKSGATYAYLGVPENRALAFMRAESKGAYFHDYIKDEYETIKAPPVPKKGGLKHKSKRA